MYSMFITRCTFLPAADERRASVAEQLKCKSFCISVICVCLTNTPQITLTVRRRPEEVQRTLDVQQTNSLSLSLSLSSQPSGNLPCPPQLIVTAVLSLLRICSGASSSPSSSSSPSTGCSEVSRNVIGSGKVQKCALEALTALSSSPGNTECPGRNNVLLSVTNPPFDCSLTQW